MTLNKLTPRNYAWYAVLLLALYSMFWCIDVLIRFATLNRPPFGYLNEFQACHGITGIACLVLILLSDKDKRWQVWGSFALVAAWFAWDFNPLDWRSGFMWFINGLNWFVSGQWVTPEAVLILCVVILFVYIFRAVNQPGSRIGNAVRSLVPFVRMPTCPACGRPVEDGTDECPSCGVVVRESWWSKFLRYDDFLKGPIRLGALFVWLICAMVLMIYLGTFDLGLVDWHLTSRSRTVSRALITAASQGRLDDARGLIERGAVVNAPDDSGNTALHLAVAGGYRNVAELLIEKGAAVNAKNNLGDTPLHQAIDYGHRDVRDMAITLLRHGADVNIRNKRGVTPLQLAVYYRPIRPSYQEVVDLLIQHGADINAK